MQEIHNIVTRTKRQLEMEKQMRHMPTFEMFHARVMEMQEAYPSWRIGQSWWNGLADMRPDIAKELRTSCLDPFYDDSRVPAFVEAVKYMWDTWDDEVRDWYKRWDGWHTDPKYTF